MTVFHFLWDQDGIVRSASVYGVAWAFQCRAAVYCVVVDGRGTPRATDW
jgi:hypothetical protein